MKTKLTYKTKIKMEKEYILVTWPESQELMDKDWFDECVLANIEDESSAYFVPKSRINELNKPI